MKRMLNRLKRERGITLVALVVTIIVLLILAGIAISLSIGNNGLFSRAKNAVEKHSEAEAREKLELALSNISFDKNLGEVDDEYIDTELERQGMVVIGDIVIVGDWQFEIDRSVPKVGTNLGKLIDKQEILKPKIKKGKIIIDNTQIEVYVELINKKGTNIIYTIKNLKEDKEVAREETTETEYVFSGLKQGTEYEIVVEVTNDYGTANKMQKVKTLLNCIPKLTETTNDILYEGFLDNYTGSWGKRNLYYAFDRDDNTCAASSKNNKEAIGSYIGYDFIEPMKVIEVAGKIRMLSYKIQYSDDSTIWKDAITSSSAGSNYGDKFDNKIDDTIEAHRYWRLYVNGGQKSDNVWSAYIYSLQFIGKQEKKVIEI